MTEVLAATHGYADVGVHGYADVGVPYYTT